MMPLHRISPPYTDDLAALLDRSLYDGQFGLDVPHEELKSAFLSELGDDTTRELWAGPDGMLMAGRPLEWDTAHFGRRCYRIDYLRIRSGEEDPRRLEEWLRRSGIELCFLRLPVSDPARGWMACSAFRLMATKLLFRKRVDGGESSERFVSLADLTAEGRERLLAEAMHLATDRFHAGRFFADDRIPDNQAAAVYAAWVAAAAAGESKGFDLLLTPSGELEGFVIWDLVSRAGRTFGFLNLALSAGRRQGVGRHMMALTEGRLAARGVGAWFANADLTNEQALRLYGSVGFVPYHAIDEYHAWLD